MQMFKNENEWVCYHKGLDLETKGSTIEEAQKEMMIMLSKVGAK